MDILDPEGEILRANGAWEKTLGYGSGELRGSHITDHMEGVSREEVDGFLRSLAEAEPIEHPDVRESDGNFYHIADRSYLRKDGTPVSVDVYRMAVRDPDGSLDQIVSLLVDITDRKNLERQLRQTEKMEALGQFAGGVAHDFNNLLTIVSSCAHLIQKGDESSIPECIDKLESVVERGQRLTEQLLAFSPAEDVERTILDLNKTVREMYALMRRLVDDDVVVDIDLASHPVYVHANRGQMEQILLNLVSNARDAMPQGGRLVISTSVRTVEREDARFREGPPRGPHAVLEVGDTGEGMDEQTLAHIFEPFFTTKQEGRGTGIGLATVYGIVQRHDGHITVDSEVGEGTTFTIFIPMTEANFEEEDVESSREVEHPEPEGGTILFVEDEDEIRRPVLVLLEEEGFDVLTAENGEVALELARRHDEPIDLLLTDVVMPERDGVELARAMEELHPGVRTVFITGYTLDTLRRKNLAPEQKVVRKPFEIADLLKTVRKVLAKGLDSNDKS